MVEKFLDKAYADGGPKDVKSFYDDWATSYEAEIKDNGYATPRRCAEALAKYTDDKSLKILDFGCGTGLSGLALRMAGFEKIDGVDLSAEMLKIAKSKSIYTDLTQIDGETLPFSPGTYSAIAGIGLIGPGAAPVSVIDTLFNALGSKGKLVVSLNDVAINEHIYEARLNEYLDDGSARLLLREYGDHLPGHDLKSYVYVIEKA